MENQNISWKFKEVLCNFSSLLDTTLFFLFGGVSRIFQKGEHPDFMRDQSLKCNLKLKIPVKGPNFHTNHFLLTMFSCSINSDTGVTKLLWVYSNIIFSDTVNVIFLSQNLQ